jgi:prepilin-type N-terminal cleavage/methylation domain
MRKGMTLIELLIVIGIIVVLAGLIFSVTLQARKRGQLSACISNLRQLVLAVHAYENDWGHCAY